MRYWEERAKEWAKARDKKEHKINAALVDSYKNAADDLQKEIAAWYEKYADAEGVSFADAKKRLDERERRALTRSVKAFEKLAKQNKDHSQDKILTKMSAAVHINRLTSMQFQMRYILYGLYSDVNNELTDGLKEFYADECEQMTYEAQMARGKFEPIATIDEKRISAVLKTPWATDGKDFSARLWNNREQLVSTLQSELTRALITGADSASVAKNIAKKMNAAQYAASRLVSTEITRIITASDIDTFAEMDIDELEVVGTLDLHTCDTCGDMDGKHMPRSEAKAGTTAPPFHPNCRCVIVPYFGDNDDARAMRDSVTEKSKTIGNMTFKEWKEKYGSDGRIEETKEQNPKQNNANNSVIISIADCKLSIRQYAFSDGTAKGIKKTVDATIYEAPDGVEFVFPERYNKAHQTMTPEQAIKCWSKVPEKIKQQAQKEIEFVDYYNPQDSYWRKRYKNFPRSYATGGDKIVFYRYDRAHNDDYVVRTYCHEIGHHIDKMKAQNGICLSDSAVWQSAMLADEKLSGKKSPTVYGENTPAEDFAESIAEYVKDPVKFTTEFPNRCGILLNNVLK